MISITIIHWGVSHEQYVMCAKSLRADLALSSYNMIVEEYTVGLYYREGKLTPKISTLVRAVRPAAIHGLPTHSRSGARTRCIVMKYSMH